MKIKIHLTLKLEVEFSSFNLIRIMTHGNHGDHSSSFRQLIKV